MKEFPYRFWSRFIRTVFKAMGYRLTIEGAHHVPTQGPALLAINHSGYLDFAFAAWSPIFERGRWPRFLAKKEVFDHRFAGPFMRAMKHIPVDRLGNPTAAIRMSIKALKDAELVATHPEGTVNRSFAPVKGKTGAVRIAQAAEAPIIPCAVWGAHRIMTKARRLNLQRRIPVMVRYGDPIVLDAREDANVATARVMQAISDLLSDLQARYPDKPKDDDDRWWLPAHLGGTAPTYEEITGPKGYASFE